MVGPAFAEPAPLPARDRRAWATVASGAVLALLAVAGAGRHARASDADPLQVARRDYAKRLADAGTAAKESKLGSIALRLFEDAYALDPTDEAARLGLGWTKSGGTLKPPDPATRPGEGWPDDGEADLARIVKKEADARSEYVKDLSTAAAAVRKADAGAADRLLWAALAVDPEDATVRRLLNHTAVDGRWVAPEHASMLRDGAKRRGDAAAAARAAARASPLAPADPPAAKVAGWPTPIAKGVKAASGDAAFSLTGGTPPAAVALAVADTRAFLTALLRAPSPMRPLQLLVVPSRDLADALFASDSTMDAAARDGAHQWAVWPLGTTGFDLLALGSGDDGDALAIDATASRDFQRRAKDANASWWLSVGAGFFATSWLVGTPRGYATTAQPLAGERGPTLAAGESVLASLRRLVATGADRPLRSLATDDVRALRPRDAAKAGSLLDYLFLSDASRASAFVATVLAAAKGGGAAAIDAAAKDAGYPSVDALEEAWRRYVVDTYPALPRDPEGPGTWKSTKLDRLKSVPDASSVYGPLVHAVSGSLWLGGRGYRCASVEDGQAVELESLVLGGAPRVVRTPDVYPFAVAPEAGGTQGRFGRVATHDVHVALARDGASWVVRAADVYGGTVDGHPLAFFDVDCDARYGGFGRDGYVVGKAPYVLPLERQVAIGRDVVDVRRVGPDGKECAWRAHPQPAKGQDLDALLQWNAWRASCGLAPLVWDDALALEAKLPEGRAPTVSLPVPSTAPGATPWWTTSVAFREKVGLAPDLRRVGWGKRERKGTTELVVVATGAAAGLPSSFRGPAIFPGSGAEGLPPADETGPFPATVVFPPGTDVAALRVEASLALEAGTAAAVDAKPSAESPNLLLFVPKGGLGHKTAYRLTVSWGPANARTQRIHVFTTGE